MFGYTEAGIVTQFLPTGFVDSFGTPGDLVMDSLVLALAYTGDYIGTMGYQRYRVFRITEDLNVDSTYYSNHVVSHDGIDLIEAGFHIQIPDPETVTVVDGDTLPVNQLRFHIDKTIGEDFFTEALNGTLNSESVFFNYFKGLYIVPDNGSQNVDDGAIVDFDLLSDYTTLTMYYKNIGVGTEDTLSFDFAVSESCERITTFAHDYTGTPVEAQLNDTTLGQQETYLQAASGVRVKLNFPHIMSYNDSNSVSINKAELVLPIDNDQVGVYLPSERVFVVGIDDEGDEFIIQDQFEGDTHVDGYWSVADSEYRLNISRYIQRVLAGTNGNNGMYLFVGDGSVTARRAVLSGPDNPTENIKLELTFTQY